jgi:cell filamentation protein
MVLDNKLNISDQVELANWNQVDKEEYLSAMQRSAVKDLEIKALLKQALTNKIDDRSIFMKGVDMSYYYEGYSQFKTEEL